MDSQKLHKTVLKIGLLSGKSLSDFRLKTLLPIMKDSLFEISLVLIDERPQQSFRQKIRKNLKRGRGLYIVVMGFNFFFRKTKDQRSIDSFCEEYNIQTLGTRDPYSEDAINTIMQHNIDILLLVGGFGIIREPLLNAAPMGVLSYHHGDMRKYRGMPPGFWELYNHDKHMGITVQVLSPGLDKGKPILERTIDIYRSDTPGKLKDRALTESIDMMYRALVLLSDKSFTPRLLDQYGKVYTLPNFRQWSMIQIKLLKRKLISEY